MRKSLVALDTTHIKEYVFGTDKLKEIRGASSLLDRLNRNVMTKLAARFNAETVYANGGSGLFLVDTDNADKFGLAVQEQFRSLTGGTASVTYVVQEIPDSKINGNIWDIDVEDELELLRYRLREAKNCPPDVITLPSHPFMRPCDACGIEYAEEKDRTEDRGPEERDALYCASCLEKRIEDARVKRRIPQIIRRVHMGEDLPEEYLWDRILKSLNKVGYNIPPDTQRPTDFNEFRLFAENKEYIGLIYADANNMGQKLDKLENLKKAKNFAGEVDRAVHQAMSLAIKQHLPINQDTLLFPFDVLLLGGDDIVMVTDAAKAMDVALTIATEFHRLTDNRHTLSVGVVLAPIKYPFRLLRKLVESTLASAKKAGAEAREQVVGDVEIDDTRINFITVAGSTSDSFKKVYDSLHRKDKKGDRVRRDEFYATLRPYNPAQLAFLLKTIREGNKLSLGRTKLHQIREAILKMNLTTSVSDSLAVLRNWRRTRREYVVEQVYAFDKLYRIPRIDLQNPASLSFRVTFPWFADGKNRYGKDTYRTSLLDFIELHDFVSREEDGSAED